VSEPLRTGRGLERLLFPRSIAVIGAGRRGLGRLVLGHVVASGFRARGELWAVNPCRRRVASVRCFPDVADLPSPPDLAVIAVDRDGAVEAVRACASAGCGAAVVVSAGFAELDAAGAEAQEAMVGAARAAGLRLLGPNCMGLINTHPRARLHAAFGFGPVRRGPVALVSQSGSVADYLLYHLDEWGLGVSLVASVGNEADVTAAELIRAAARDERTRVVAVFVERGRRLDEIAAAIDRVTRERSDTPVVALCGGADGERAAMERWLHDAGAVNVRSLEALMAACAALGRDPAGFEGALAIVTNAGGPAALALDAARELGLEVMAAGPRVAGACGGELSPNAILTGAAADLTASARPGHFAAAARALRARAGALLCLVMSPEGTDPGPVVRAVRAAWPGPLAFCLLAAGPKVERARRAAVRGGAVTTREPALALGALAALASRARIYYERNQARGARSDAGLEPEGREVEVDVER
jgi:acyl-CoA synthetase (NDP forming)